MKKTNVLDFEKNIGINTYFTPYPGIGGKLRSIPEDFNVKENSIFPSEKVDGKFLIAEVESINWETNLLIRELSKKLNFSRKRIGFAGTKDKRAKKTQIMSFYNISEDKLKKVKIKDVLIKNVNCSDKPVKIGDLIGNDFEIIVRNIDKNIDLTTVEENAKKIKNIGGFPNFYGVQRFGIIRPITHVVGKHIINGDFEKAVMTYIANPIDGENEESYVVRKNLEETNDYAEALKKFPKYLIFEKAILNKLIQNPNDFVGALKELPGNLLTMFVYAYQSYIFNMIISERINNNLSINEAVIDDVILPVRKKTIDIKNPIIASKSNIEKINKQILKKKAVVSGLLIGSDSTFSNGVIGDIEKKIISKEKIEPRDFIIPDMPFLSSHGSRRAVLGFVKNLEYSFVEDSMDGNKKMFIIKFGLDKGSYATCLLREFMKADDIRNY